MIYQQFRDLAPVFGLLTNGFVLPNVRANRRGKRRSAPSINRFRGATMPLTRNTPGVRPAQEFTDPLITNARLVNLAAEIERNLAARRALRPIRSEAARKGWGTRRGI